MLSIIFGFLIVWFIVWLHIKVWHWLREKLWWGKQDFSRIEYTTVTGVYGNKYAAKMQFNPTKGGYNDVCIRYNTSPQQQDVTWHKYFQQEEIIKQRKALGLDSFTGKPLTTQQMQFDNAAHAGMGQPLPYPQVGLPSAYNGW